MRFGILAVVAGCSLTSHAPPLRYRYFAPPAMTTITTTTTTTTTTTCSRLHLGRISASDHLRYRIAHRRSPVEIELSETLRWTERPEDYVRRALASSLFDQRGLHLAVDAAAPTLDVEITAFEEVERGAQHLGRVELRYQLADERDVLQRQTIAVEREAATAEIKRVVAVIGDALAAATDELGHRVALELCH